MSAGLQVFNDSGSFQIDERNKNLVLTAKGRLTLGSSGTWSGSGVPPTKWDGVVSISNAVNPILCHAAGNNLVTAWTMTISGSSWSWYFVSSDGAAVVDYWIFDAPTAAGAAVSENFGLEVFDSTGARTFHSSQKPLRIVDVRSLADGFDGFAFETIEYPGGRTYAVAQCSYRSIAVGALSELSPEDPPLGQAWYDYLLTFSAAKVAVQTVTITDMTMESYQYLGNANGSGSSLVKRGERRILVVDVTDY